MPRNCRRDNRLDRSVCRRGTPAGGQVASPLPRGDSRGGRALLSTQSLLPPELYRYHYLVVIETRPSPLTGFAPLATLSPEGEGLSPSPSGTTPGLEEVGRSPEPESRMVGMREHLSHPAVSRSISLTPQTVPQKTIRTR